MAQHTMLELPGRHENDIEQLLAEAKALHRRVAAVLHEKPSNTSDYHPLPQILPNQPSVRNRPEIYSSTGSLQELLRRGRSLDEKVKRLKVDLPSPQPCRRYEDKEIDGSGNADTVLDKENVPPKDVGEETVEELYTKRPSSAPISRPMKDDKLTRPTVRPILRIEPGLPAYKNDPVARYELYKKEWEKFPPPGQKNHAALRWKVREYMLRVDLPSGNGQFRTA